MRELTERQRDRHQVLGRLAARRGRLERSGEVHRHVDHDQADELAATVDTLVQRRRADADGRGDPLHREPLEALRLEDGPAEATICSVEVREGVGMGAGVLARR